MCWKLIVISRDSQFNVVYVLISVTKSIGLFGVVSDWLCFRNVTDEDDTPQLLEILADERLTGVTQLDVNYDANQGALLNNSDLRQIHLITTSDFDTDAMWDTLEA